MPQRIAAISSIVVFTGCLVAGAFGAENTFVTAVERALAAMIVTLFVGLAVGWMAQKMVNENVAAALKTPAAPEPKEVAQPKLPANARKK
jgi:hypothetical protein